MLYAVGTDLGSLQNAGAVPRLIRGRKTFTGAANAGNLGDSFPVFVTTGVVLVNVAAGAVSTALVCSAAADTAVQWNRVNAGSAAQWTVEDIAAADTLLAPGGQNTAGAIPYDLTGDALGTVINDDLDGLVTDLASGADITAGAIDYYLLYTPLSAGASMSLGAGMVAI